MEDIRCRAYNGGEKYAFISYAHADDGRVLPVVDELYRRRYRAWYDEGIEVGANWPKKVATRLKNSELVILFLSNRFIASQNCMRELNYAVSERRKLLCVTLEPVKLPEDTAMQLSTVDRLDASDMTPQELVEEISSRGAVDDSFLGNGIDGYARESAGVKRSLNLWRAAGVIFALLFAAVTTFLFGYINGWFGVGVTRGEETVTKADGETEQVEVTTWNDPVARDLMLRSSRDSVLYLCGDSILNTPAGISYDGTWRAGRRAVGNGGLSDFSALSGRNLTHFSAVYQELTDISGIAGFTELVYLDLSGNDISDISPIGSLEKLEILKIEHIAAKDLSVLKRLPALKRVYVSGDMAGSCMDMLDCGFDVILKK